MTRFDFRLWQRFRGLATPYWFRDKKWQARGLLLLLVVLLLGQTGFAVLFNELTGEFTSALAAKDEDRFWRSIVQCLGILVVAVPIYAFYYFVRDKLGPLLAALADAGFSRQLLQQSGLLRTECQPRISTTPISGLPKTSIPSPRNRSISCWCWSAHRCNSSPSVACFGPFPKRWSFFLIVYAFAGTAITVAFLRQGADRA
jgi:hypothetical protein